MKTFKLVQVQTSDGPAIKNYRVVFEELMNVQEFLKCVLKRNEWGSIRLIDHSNALGLYTALVVDYRDDYYERGQIIPEPLLNRIVSSATALNESGKMDYNVVLFDGEKNG